MMATKTTTGVRAVQAKAAPASAVRPRAVVAKAQRQQPAAASAKAPLLSGLVASVATTAAPALALVDDRMNGDGTGLPLGVNDPALAIALASVVTFVWTQYYLSQRDLGGDKGDDSPSRSRRR